MPISEYNHPLDSIAIFDPAIATRNVGDEIISEAARREVLELFPNSFQATIPTHERIGVRSYRFCHQSRQRIIAGSNIFTANMLFDRQWRLRPWDVLFVKDMVALGVGWRKHGERVSFVSDLMLRRVLSKKALHSVRDEHTRKELVVRGIKNVLNTACVTMWNLDLEYLANLPRDKAARVVTTLNVGRRSALDRELLGLLVEEYEDVAIWQQGIDDELYIDQLCREFPSVRRIPPTLASFDRYLKAEQDVEYVGNRLHGGIRAMQHKRRALILSVDNRASEIARDTNIPSTTLDGGIVALRKRIRRPLPIEIRLPREAIAQWRGQFEAAPSSVRAHQDEKG